MRQVMSAVATMCLGLAATTLSAAPPEDAALVQSAIGYPAAVIQPALEISKRRVAEAMSIDPNSPLGAVIVFARGLDSTETAAFAESYQLAILRAEAKVYVRTTGATETMSFGAQTLFSLDGPLAERLETLIGRMRGDLMNMARTEEVSEPTQGAGLRAAGLREAGESPDIRLYKVEVVGPASSFDRIEHSGEAAAIFVDGSQARVEQLSQQRANVAHRRAAQPEP
jgi:hypothetical protein